MEKMRLTIYKDEIWERLYTGYRYEMPFAKVLEWRRTQQVRYLVVQQ